MAPSLSPLERLQRSGIRPDKNLGQNFLIDPNILDVIERTAGLAPEDVILEVGPGLGVLTERLLDRSCVVHCLEMDSRLAQLLAEEFGVRPGFRLHAGDAMRLPLASLDPAPTKFVSNLPYNVAAPLVMKSFQELPSIGLWCLMVQKEIADRLFAPASSACYGGVSVMTQLMAEKISARQISSRVFFPEPRVRSSLLAFRRRAAGYTAGHFAEVRAIVYACFGHRRKKLVNSIAEAAPAPPVLSHFSQAEKRTLAADTLRRVGFDPEVRAQALTPPQLEQFARAVIESRP